MVANVEGPPDCGRDCSLPFPACNATSSLVRHPPLIDSPQSARFFSCSFGTLHLALHDIIRHDSDDQ